MRKSVKYCKPQRIVNPVKNWHSVRLLPGQPFVVKLKKPNEFLAYCSDDARFKVELKSDFLFVEEEECDREKCSEILRIGQKYDLSPWTAHGQVLLGHVEIKLVNNTHKEKDKCKFGIDNISQLVVFLNSKHNHVITVVNPVGSFVKLKPNQYLEVVCSWPTLYGDPIQLSYDNWSFETTNNTLSKIAYEPVGEARQDEIETIQDVLVLKHRHKKLLNPRLKSVYRKKFLDNSPSPRCEHHYWFSFNDSIVTDSDKEAFPVDEITFLGKKDSVQVVRSLKIIYDNKNKKLSSPITIENLLSKVKKKDILRNPLRLEHVDFEDGRETVTIELIQPKCIWEDLSDDVRWEFGFEKEEYEQSLTLSKLSDIGHLGKTFQRIKIDNIFFQNVKESVCLGKVLITCPPKKDTEEGVKAISIWYHPAKRNKAKQTSTKYTTDLVSKNNNSSAATVYKKKNNQRDDLKIYDVEFKIKSSSLFLDEDEEMTHTIFKYAGNYSSKNYSSNIINDDDDFVLSGKKKELWTSGENASNKEKKNERRGSIWINTRSGWDTKNISYGNDASTIIYNPNHTEKIKVTPGKPIIIRLTQPENEPWKLYSLIEDLKFKTVEGEKENYFEVILSIKKDDEVKQGETVGALRFERCNGVIKMIQLVYNIEDKEEVNLNVKTLNRLTDHYIRDWKHNDAFLIDPIRQVWIKPPDNTSDWDKNSWSAEIVQASLPEEIYKHPLLSKKYIDPENPWFPSNNILKLASVYQLRKLAVSQPLMKEIFEAYADLTGEDSLFLGKISFKNNNHKNNFYQETTFGIMDRVVSIQKDIYLFANIREYVKKDIVLVDPKDNEECCISDYNKLILQLSPLCYSIKDQIKELKWFVANVPFCFQKYDHIRNEGKQEFVFTIKKNHMVTGVEYIKMVCGNHERKIKTKYEIPS